jgi:hypothetical protein
VDKPQINASNDRVGLELPCSVSDHAAKLRRSQDDQLKHPHAGTGELSRTTVPEERGHGGPNRADILLQRNPVSGGSGDVREDSWGVELRRQVDEFTSFRVDPKNVKTWWPIVRSGIEYVIEKTKAPFIAEDVYSYCSRDEAWLIVTYDKQNRYAGCVVVAQSALNNFATKPEMLIWVAYSKVPGAAESTLAKVETIAKNLGFGYIVFHSPRDGWKRRAKALGFTLRERVYEKKLD